MTDKDIFYDLVADILSSEDVIPKKETDKLWKWFQSKQQEKIERVKRLREDFYPKDRFSDGYQIAISDVLEILKDESKRVN